MKIKLLVFFAILGFLPQKSYSQQKKRILSLEAGGGWSPQFIFADKDYIETPDSEILNLQSFFNFKTGFGKNLLLNTGMGLNTMTGHFDYVRSVGDTTSFDYTRSDMCFKIGLDYRIIGTDENTFNLYGGLKLLWFTRTGYSLTNIIPGSPPYLKDPISYMMFNGQASISAFRQLNERAGMHFSIVYLLAPNIDINSSSNLRYSSLGAVVGIDYYLE